jgi:HSP20 family protein
MDHPLFHLLSFPDELQPSLNPPAQKYVRDSKARASTAMDVKEHPQSYVFVADMPGLKSADIKVHRCPHKFVPHIEVLHSH